MATSVTTSTRRRWAIGLKPSDRQLTQGIQDRDTFTTSTTTSMMTTTTTTRQTLTSNLKDFAKRRTHRLLIEFKDEDTFS